VLHFTSLRHSNPAWIARHSPPDIWFAVTTSKRWLLKTVKAMAVSKNLARGGERLSGAFWSDAAILNMLDDPTHWPDGAGLYCVMNAGEQTQNHNRFQLQPYMNKQDEINGLAVNIMGLSFVLMLEPPDLNIVPQFKQAKYRPNQITVSYPHTMNWIAISWDDGKQHNETLSLQFLQTVGSS
jgi:hypothetical protein